MRRPIALAVACAFTCACGGVDQAKFEGVFKAGKALQAEVQASGGALNSQSRDRLKQFDTEIDALRDRTIGTHEADVLQAFAEAADAYRYFLRFRALDPEAGTGQILLKGPNIEVATRFKLPVDTRDGAKLVNRGQAITILLQAGEQHLSDGNRILGRP
jgi:RNase P/RNase MRP subunit p29